MVLANSRIEEFGCLGRDKGHFVEMAGRWPVKEEASRVSTLQKDAARPLRIIWRERGMSSKKREQRTENEDILDVIEVLKPKSFNVLKGGPRTNRLTTAETVSVFVFCRQPSYLIGHLLSPAPRPC